MLDLNEQLARIRQQETVQHAERRRLQALPTREPSVVVMFRQLTKRSAKAA